MLLAVYSRGGGDLYRRGQFQLRYAARWRNRLVYARENGSGNRVAERRFDNLYDLHAEVGNSLDHRSIWRRLGLRWQQIEAGETGGELSCSAVTAIGGFS